MKPGTRVKVNDDGRWLPGTFDGKASRKGYVYVQLDDEPLAPDGNPIISLVKESDVVEDKD